MTERLGKIFVPLFFAVYLLIGIMVHSDYGVSWDEPISRTNGLVNLKYLETRFAPGLITDEVRNQQDLATWTDRDYGVAFELPLVMLEQAFHVDEEHLYPFRHLITFLFSALGVLAIYKTAKFVYGDYRLGLLAALMIVLSPRMFAESFYNSKDMVFMSAIAMAIYTLTRLTARPRLRIAAFHGVLTALAIDIRVMGVLIVAATLGLLLVRRAKKEIAFHEAISCLAVYLVVTAFVVVALFPFLWSDSVGNFVGAFANMAKFRWQGWVLYAGTNYFSSTLPWHYVPVWILITTPPVFSALMVAGLARSTRTVLKSRATLWTTETQMAELTFVALLVLPILAVISLHSVVYDGWRHLYFIYPALVLVAVGGVAALRDVLIKMKLAGAGLLLLVLVLCGNVYWMVVAHPLQNVYFNRIAGTHWKDKFELDYWGLGNWAMLKSVLDQNGGRPVAIKAISATALDRALMSMSRQERDKFVLTSPDAKPEFFVLTNYRNANFCLGQCDLTDYHLYLQVKVHGEVVISVFRIKDMALADRITMIDRPYTADEFRGLSYSVVRRYQRGGEAYVDLKIVNAGSLPMAAVSSVGKPIRISWRFVDAKGISLEGWNTRQELPRDIPAHGELTVPIHFDASKETPGGTVEFGLLQEGVAWGHDSGLVDASMPAAVPES